MTGTRRQRLKYPLLLKRRWTNEHVGSEEYYCLKNFDNLSRRNANDGKIAGRGATMMAEPKSDPDQVVCRYCNKQGHYQRGCALFTMDRNNKKYLPSKRARLGWKATRNIKGVPVVVPRLKTRHRCLMVLWICLRGTTPRPLRTGTRKLATCWAYLARTSIR